MGADISFGIDCAAYHLPEEEYDIFFWGDKTEKDPAVIDRMQKNGSLRYRKAHESVSVADLAKSAVARLFQTSDIDPRSVDLVLYTHTMPYSFPSAPLSVVEMIKSKFGLDRAVGFAIAQQACSTMHVVLKLIRSRMSVDKGLNRVLCVTADKVMNENYRNLEDRAILSDGAAAMIVTRGGEYNVVRSIALQFDGRHYGGISVDPSLLSWRDQNYCVMVYRLINRAIAGTGAPRETFTRVLPPNFRLPHARQIMRLLKMAPEALFVENVATRGHIFNSDTVMNLVDLSLDPDRAGDNALSYATGNYGCFAAMAVENLRRLAA
jgi:3-oxoacyl-[acyl-carrier-protein] synthase-3